MKGDKITDIERNYIAKNYLLSSDYTIGKVLNRSTNSITQIRLSLKLLREGYGCTYTDKEVTFITENYLSMTDLELATHLNRSEKSIVMCRSRNGLKRVRKKVDQYLNRRLARMQELIKVCENSSSPYRLDKAKEELRKLSGL